MEKLQLLSLSDKSCERLSYLVVVERGYVSSEIRFFINNIVKYVENNVSLMPDVRLGFATCTESELRTLLREGSYTYSKDRNSSMWSAYNKDKIWR